MSHFTFMLYSLDISSLVPLVA